MSILYIVVDDTLPKSHQAAQAGHGVAAFFLACPTQAKEWNNGTLVLLKGDVQAIAQKNEISTPIVDAIWREPDLGNRITALAFWRPPNDRIFDGYPLL